MNAQLAWDDEQRLAAAPVPAPSTDLTLDTLDTAPSDLEGATTTDLSAPSAPGAGLDDVEHADPVTIVPVPGGHRGAALADAIQSLDPAAGLSTAVEHLLAAIDAADADAGIARVDTADAVLQQRIARIVSGASLPSRGPGTRARDILALLSSHRAV
jgi:hypothetical protein